MKKYKEWLPVAGMTVILLVLSFVLFFSVRDQPDPGRTPETTTVMKKEDKDESTTKGSKRQTEETDEGNSIEVYGIGHLYYLDPEGGQTFERRLTRFIRDQKIDAGSAEVLDYHIDDRKQESEPAQFFLRLDDSRHTIVRVSFKRRKELTGSIFTTARFRMGWKTAGRKRSTRFQRAQRTSPFLRTTCLSQIRKTC